MCRRFSASVLNVWQALLTPEVSYSGIRFGNNMSSMGARVTRMFRNFNLENRAHREISKDKPLAAPRHSVNIVPAPSTEVTEITEDIHNRNDPLLSLLKSVYVESNDPTTEEPKQVTEGTNAGRRKLKFSLPGSPYGIVEITDVPKGKLSIVEALTVLNHHKQEPQRWTPDKIAQEYCLDPKDSQALLDFFIPFEVKIIPPKTKDTKQIKDN